MSLICVYDNTMNETHRLTFEDLNTVVVRKLRALYAFGGFCKMNGQRLNSIEELLGAYDDYCQMQLAKTA